MATEGEAVVKSSQVPGNCDAAENEEISTCEETKACEKENMDNHEIKDYLSKEKEAAGNGEQIYKEVASPEAEAEGIIISESERDEEGRKGAISEGRESCREYIKGFLASLAVRQLKLEMSKGSIREHRIIYERLQIDLHYVPPPPPTTGTTD